nr:ATP synthase F0 subunit 8 [Lepisiota frauenfeldi]
MPHMMPMMWLILMIFSMTLLFMIISLFYFLCLPPKPYIFLPPSSKMKWNWKW